MKTFRCNRPVNPAKLHDELVAAGVPVVTVRASRESAQHAAFCAVVVTEDGATAGQVASIVAAHAHGLTPSAKVATEVDLTAHEDGRGKGWLFIGAEKIV